MAKRRAQRRKRTAHVGAIAANLHEGSRSEYLAQYVFASFGTASPVPHQEDNGIDLYCSLTETIGRRSWPRAYFSVQVKSRMTAWNFEGHQSVKWLLEHPLPFFLCVVDKSSARLRVYQTLARFSIWSLPPFPKRVRLVPDDSHAGRHSPLTGGQVHSLSAPILDFTIQQLLNKDFHRKAWDILKFWCAADLANLDRIRAGLHTFTMPYEYHTNGKASGGWVTQEQTSVENLDPALSRIRESVDWLSSQLFARGDLRGAARCAIFLRHFFRDEHLASNVNLVLSDRIVAHSNATWTSSGSYVYAATDHLERLIDDAIGQRSPST
jgi:hypothetical protein